jgi:hypothetical protein
MQAAIVQPFTRQQDDMGMWAMQWLVSLSLFLVKLAGGGTPGVLVCLFVSTVCSFQFGFQCCILTVEQAADLAQWKL